MENAPRTIRNNNSGRRGRAERRFKVTHHGKAPKHGTAIQNRDYGNNKYWKMRNKRAAQHHRRQKYIIQYELDTNETATYAAWDAHIALLVAQQNKHR